MSDFGAALNADAIGHLAALLRETGLLEIELEQDGCLLRVVRPVTAPLSPLSAPRPQSAPPVTAKPTETIVSTVVGIAYRGLAPGARPFVDIGSVVEAGQKLLFVDVLSTLTTIDAPRAGRIVEIAVEDGQLVEYGQPLFVLE
ncbi:MAG: biotin/lipoyl-binding protein [Azospirillaceae bacterium]|nr:biotin/lipoyl-binding protein [Azospirillaceae bacterium]